MGQRDADQAGAAWTGDGGDHDGAGAHEEEEKGADRLGNQCRPGSLAHALLRAGRVAPPEGLEPPTPALGRRRSIL